MSTPLVEIWREEYSGTGYAINSELVLTAGHVVGSERRVQIRRVGTDVPIDGQVVWHGKDDIDAALVRVSEELEAPVDLRWGSVDGRERLPWFGGGFPEAAIDLRDTVGVGGFIEPFGGLERHLHEMTVDGETAAREWRGLSGGPVMVGGHLVGVIRAVPESFEGRRLSATPVARMFEDHEFRRLVGDPPLQAVGHRKNAVPSQAELPAASYVPRPETRTIVSRLLASRNWPTLGKVAVWGMAGSGKTALAKAVAHDPEIVRGFPDGILWAQLGEEPVLGEALHALIRGLGDQHFRAVSAGSAKAHLQTQLSRLSVLLIVDDAWNPAHFDAMAVGGPRCAVLVTTREQVVVRKVPDDDRLELGMLEPKRSLQVLAGGPGHTIENLEDRSMALEVADALGHLPLALELGAQQVRSGETTWIRLRNEVVGEIARLEELEDPAVEDLPIDDRRYLSLVASLHVSLRRLSRGRLERFCWLGVLPEEDVIGVESAVALWGTESREVRRELMYFRSRALLLLEGEQSYRMHDTVRHMARNLISCSREQSGESLPGLGLTWRAAHSSILDRYARLRVGEVWSSIPSDQYFYRHAAWHFEQAERTDELIGILREETDDRLNAWFQHQDAEGAYATDVNRALRWAREKAVSYELDVVELNLVLASLEAMTGNMPATLLGALVGTGQWTVPSALGHAELQTEPANRSRCFAILAEHAEETLAQDLLRRAASAVPSLGTECSEVTSFLVPRLVARGLVEEARGIVEYVDHGDARTAALAALPMTQEVVREAIEMIGSTGEVFRAAAVFPMLPHLPVESLRSIVEDAEAMSIEFFADSVREMVVDGLASRDLELADDIAKSISNASSHAAAHASLALHSKNPKPHVEVALATMRRYRDEDWRADFQKALSSYEDFFQAIMMAVIAGKSWRAELLGKLSSLLNSEVAESIVFEAVADDDVFFAVTGSAQLLPRLSETGSVRRDVVKRILERLGELDELSQVKPLSIAVAASSPAPEPFVDRLIAIYEATGGSISQDLAPAAGEIARRADWVLRIVNSTQADHRRDAVDLIAPQAESGLLPGLLELSRVIADEDATVVTLSRLSCGVEPAAQGRLLERIDRLENTYIRSMALEALVPDLPDELMPKAEEILSRIDNDYGRAEAALRGFYRRASPKERQKWLDEAIAITAEMTDGERVGWIYEAWLPELEGDLPAAMLEAARGLDSRADDDGWAVSCACLALLPRVDAKVRTGLFNEILSRASALDEGNRPSVLGRLADHATPSELKRIQELVAAIEDPMNYVLAYAWTGVGRDFPLDAFEQLSSREHQDTASGWLIPLLNTEDALILLEKDEELADHSIRNALKGLARKISPSDRERAVQLAQRRLEGRDLSAVLIDFSGTWGSGCRELSRLALEAAVSAPADVRTDTNMREAVVACLEEDDDFVRRCWTETQDKLGTLRRNDAMAKLYSLAPMIARVGGERATAQTFGAIERVTRWWP